MANRTQKGVRQIKGTNPQYLVEKIIRMRIYDSRYWKEHCFALTAETVVDRGVELRFIGGVYGGNIKPTPFLCLTLKMLQIQPDKDIIIEYIRQEDFKYLRALGAMYMRLTGTSAETYKYLEPLFNDYRKLRWMNKMGQFEILHMDAFIDRLLRDERVCDIQLPRLQKREVLVEAGELQPYKSALEDDIEAMEDSSDEESKTTRKTLTKHDEEAREADRKQRREVEKRMREKEIAAHIAAGMDAKEAEEKVKNERRKDRGDKPHDEKRKKEKKKEKERKERLRETSEEREIREQNELRAKLGLAPLEK